jgi:hypothetical protein
LPNGCNFHVTRPVSLRHNDIFTFHQSNLEQILTDLQRNQVKKYKIFGDSAYTVLGVDSNIAYRIDDAHGNDILVNRAMSSCRESIEWNYGDLKKTFKLIDYPKALKIRQNDVQNIILCAFVLRNLHNCMNGGITSGYFQCNPPSFDEYVAQGPRNE